MNIDGSGLKQLTKGNTNDLGPVMSPDGSLIAFATMRDIGDYQADLCIMDRDGRRKKVLTPGPAHDFNPVFSKDGKKIYFRWKKNLLFSLKHVRQRFSHETTIMEKFQYLYDQYRWL